MALVQPASTSLEKLMSVPVGGSTLFMFSGYAWFGGAVPTGPLWDVGNMDGLVGNGDSDTGDQGEFEVHEITDLYVGPHWEGRPSDLPERPGGWPRSACTGRG